MPSRPGLHPRNRHQGEYDFGALVRAFDAARAPGQEKPKVIICDTKMAKGVPFLEQREKHHFIRVDPPEWQKAIAILDQSQAEEALQ